MSLRIHLPSTVAIAVLLVAAASACSGAPDGPAAPTGEASSSAGTAYTRPRDVCAAVPAAQAQQLRMRRPNANTYQQFARDDTRPEGPLVDYDLVTCEWVVDNPARGAGGQPNQMTVTVSYAVIDPARPSAADVARSVLDRGKQKLTDTDQVTVVREAAAPVTQYDGYYVYLTHKSVTGADGEVHAAVQLANAVVTVEFSGADLRRDRSKRPGFQEETRPVPESRLQPTVTSVLPRAIDHLQNQR